MKEILVLCTTNFHFTFDGVVDLQADGVAMGSPVGPVLAGIFMVELERALLPTLPEFMLPSKRYVDDPISWINSQATDRITNVLNGFHESIKFTREI
eukprot:gene16365-18008_t